MTSEVANSNFNEGDEVPEPVKSPVKPLIFIIHGAYCTPDIWQPFIKTLESAGYEAVCPQLPTCGEKETIPKGLPDQNPAEASYEDDVKTIKQEILQLVAAKRSFAILAHSYGGLVAAEAVDAELWAQSRTPGTGGVTQFILLSTWVPLKGTSMRDCLELHGYKSDADLGINEDGTSIMKNAAYVFFNDVEQATRADELASACVTHNWAATAHKIQSTPWTVIPTTYIHCKKDKAIWFELQEMMVKDTILKVGVERLRTEALDTGHSPFITSPEQLLRVIQKTLASLEAGFAPSQD